jgi:hypothetical protein
MRCVVCEQPVDTVDALYANAWEKSRKRYPCCTPACAASFDPDVHWLPAVAPAPASEADRARLLIVFRDRLAGGDCASVVLREMLLAGVPPEPLRGLLIRAIGQAEASRRDQRVLTAISALGGLLSGRWRLYRAGDRRDPEDLRSSLADLEAWEAHAQRSAPRN